ncbi:MAG: hypothetical protein L6Q95_18680 [Planctomycetes bacterium]|nr:hypothetical protein [Planctomycetota bacterium]
MRTRDASPRRFWTRGMVTTLFALMLTGCNDCEDYVPPALGEPQETAPVSDPANQAEVEARLAPPPERSRAG